MSHNTSYEVGMPCLFCSPSTALALPPWFCSSFFPPSSLLSSPQYSLLPQMLPFQQTKLINGMGRVARSPATRWVLSAVMPTHLSDDYLCSDSAPLRRGVAWRGLGVASRGEDWARRSCIFDAAQLCSSAHRCRQGE